MAGIVVRVGREDRNVAVLKWADLEARRSGERLTLLSPWKEAIDLVIDVPAGLLPEVTVPVTCRTGSPSIEVEMLRDNPALVVLSGAGGPDRRSRVVMTHASCPVVLVPESLRSPRGRIAVGVCGTAASRAALTYAAALARSLSAELMVVHAWQRPFGSMRQSGSTRQFVHSHRNDPQSLLDDWIGKTTGPVSVQLRNIEGPPMEVLLEAADDGDLLIMGRHLHTHLAQIWHGALAADVSRYATCPVLVVPS